MILRLKQLFSALLVAACLYGALQAPAEEEPAVYPTPQECRLTSKFTTVKQVSVRMRNKESKRGLWAKLPEDNEGAYALRISKGRMEVYANTPTGVFYAKQTVSQLLQGVPEARNAQADPFPEKDIKAVAALGKLPEGTICDWPDLPYRGSVEGYYGIPWSFEARKSQFAFYGRNKMNTYIYAPKDDPLHHGMGCYRPYPAEKAKELRELVQYARKNHVKFVWAIHPANTVNWNQDGGKQQLDGLCSKLKLMYDLGVRDFGVLVDDSGGEINRPERQVELCNYILQNFIRKHKDVNQTLIMCPTGYNRSWTNENFLTTLGRGLDKSIPVMWTGNTVVHDITLEGQKWVNQHVQRPTFIWWNWPCNDFKRARLSMGRTYGLGTEEEMKKSMSGFVANPMEHAEASKVGLFGVGDYAWNITAFNSEKNWRAGVERLYPTCAEAMQTFCNHNSYLLPNGHGYFREESVAIEAAAKTFVESLQQKEVDRKATATLRSEFRKVESSGKKLLKAKGIKPLQEDISPWMQQFALLGEAGYCATAALLDKSRPKRLAHFFDAVDAVAQMAHTERQSWEGGGTKAVKEVEVGMKSLTPCLHAALRVLNPMIYEELTRHNLPAAVFSTNAGNASEGASLLADANPQSFWASGRHQKVGDWYCLDFGESIRIRNVQLLMAGERREDYANSLQLEISDNGQNWKPLGAPMAGPAVVLNVEKKRIRARMLRFRILEQKEKGLSICEFGVNRSLQAFVSSKMAQPAPFSVSSDDKSIGIARIMEYFSLGPRERIALEFPMPVDPRWLELDLGNTDLNSWASIECISESGRKHQLKGQMHGECLRLEDKDLPQGKISAVRLVNTSRQRQQIKLTRFCVGCPQFPPGLNPAALQDNDLTTVFDSGKGEADLFLTLPSGCKEVLVIGTADCTVADAEPASSSRFVKRFKFESALKKARLKAPRQEGKRIYEVVPLGRRG